MIVMCQRRRGGGGGGGGGGALACSKVVGFISAILSPER
jgi:hypothetical protein